MKHAVDAYLRTLENRAMMCLLKRSLSDTKQDKHLELMGEYNAICHVISDFTGEQRHDVAARLRREAKL